MSALFVMFWYQFGPSMAFVQASIFASVLMALFCIDFDHYILPDKLTLPLILTGPLWHLFDGYFLRSFLAAHRWFHAAVDHESHWQKSLQTRYLWVWRHDVGRRYRHLVGTVSLGVSLYMSFSWAVLPRLLTEAPAKDVVTRCHLAPL